MDRLGEFLSKSLNMNINIRKISFGADFREAIDLESISVSQLSLKNNEQIHHTGDLIPGFCLSSPRNTVIGI